MKKEMTAASLGNALFLTFLFVWFSLSVTAETLSWKTSLQSGDLAAPASWTTEVEPGETSGLKFVGLGSPVAASLSKDLSVASLEIQDADVTFGLGDGTLTVRDQAYVKGPSAAGLVTKMVLESGILVGSNQWHFGAVSATPVQVEVSGRSTLLQVAGGDIANGGNGHGFKVVNGGKFLTTAHFCVGNYGNDNVMIVEGEGSSCEALVNAARLNVGGGNRSGNKLIIRKGGRLDVPSGNSCYLEVGAGSTSATNPHHNELILMDAGTVGVVGQLTLSTWGKTNSISVLDGAVLYVTNSFGAASRVQADGNRFVVSNATFEACKRDGASGRADGSINHNTDVLITGPSAFARFDQLAADNGCTVRIFDGAVVTNAGQWNIGNTETGCSHLIISNAILNAGYNINAGNYTTNCSVQVLGGGKLYNPNFFFDIGSQSVGKNDYMLVNGVGSFVSASRFRLGGDSSYCWTRISSGGELTSGSVEIGANPSAISNRLEVVAGGRLTGTSNGTLYFGRNAPGARNSILLVHDGLVDFSSGNGNLNMRGAGVLRLEGTNTLVKMNYIQLKESSVIEFKPPEDAAKVESAYCQLRQWNAANADGTTVLRVVEAEKCMHQGGGTYTLLTCANNDLDTFTFAELDLPPRTQVIREARAIKIKIPSTKGTVVFLR